MMPGFHISVKQFIHLLSELSVSHLALPIVLVGLLFFLNLFTPCNFFCNVHILSRLQIGEISGPLSLEILKFHIIFEIDLIQEVLLDELLHVQVSLVLLIKHLISLLGTEMWLVVFSFDVVVDLFFITVTLYLLGKESQVLQIVLLSKLLLVNCDQVLLMLLPAE